MMASVGTDVIASHTASGICMYSESSHNGHSKKRTTSVEWGPTVLDEHDTDSLSHRNGSRGC